MSAASKPPPGDWALDAECRGLDPDYFLPADRDPFHPAALEACAACTVRAECLEYALTAPWARWGLWGGTGPRERRAILRRRRREAE